MYKNIVLKYTNTNIRYRIQKYLQYIIQCNVHNT